MEYRGNVMGTQFSLESIRNDGISTLAIRDTWGMLDLDLEVTALLSVIWDQP